MTFQELITGVLGWYKGRPDATNDLAKKFINEVYQQQQFSFRFYELDATGTITTESGTQAYNLPDGVGVVRTVRDMTHGQPLDIKDIGWLEALEDSGEMTTGHPLVAVRYGDQLLFEPTPDGEYEIRVRGFARVSRLVNLTDEPVYPEEWHPVIEKLAASALGFYLGEESRAMNIKNEALGMIATLQEVPTAEQRYRTGQLEPQRRRPGGSTRYGRPRADDPNG